MHLEMKRQVNSETDDMDTQRSDSKHTWRRSGKHTRRKAGERNQQLKMIKCTEHWADVKCTYKCTDLEDDQCDCKSTGEMMGRSSEFDLCRTSAFMSTEAVPNETENDLRKDQIVYRTASRDTVTERHHETVETTTER
jgi:hypothetical protein